MKLFLTIAVPWIGSLALFFYIGLKLGSTDRPDPHPSDIAKSAKNLNGSTPNKVKKQTDQSKTFHSAADQPLPTKSPEMPPNLQRIMQGGDIVERLGSYLDAVRSMDRSNVKEVVKAFEELPGGYGRHLEMKLLMRSWANFDPEGALAYASTSLDVKSERRFVISEDLAGWAVKDEKAAIGWANQNHPAGKNG